MITKTQNIKHIQWNNSTKYLISEQLASEQLASEQL